MSKQSYFKQFRLTYVHSLVLFDPKTGPYQVLPIQARVNLGAMAMKGCTAFPKLTVDSSSEYLVSYTGHSLGVGIIPLKSCSLCILQPQPTVPPRHLLKGFYPSAEIQAVYSIAQTDWARTFWPYKIFLKQIILDYFK